MAIRETVAVDEVFALTEQFPRIGSEQIRRLPLLVAEASRQPLVLARRQ